MPTTTLTVNRLGFSRRPRSLSLVASRSVPILSVPAEIALDILELAILDSKATTFSLAVVSKAISKFIDTILYRTVILSSPQAVTLFHRTTTTKSCGFFTSHVKKLALLLGPEIPRVHICTQIAQIIGACTGLRTLAIPPWVNLTSAVCTTTHPDLSEITIESYDDDDNEITQLIPLQGSSLSPTHLRICEPSDTWHPPSSMLASFGSLPFLTHLQLSRRTNANEDNDIIFAEDIRAILKSHLTLKMLVVSIFAPDWLFSSSTRISNVWQLLQSIRDGDQRLVVLEAKYGEWKDEWKGSAVVASASGPVDFWTTALTRSENAGSEGELTVKGGELEGEED